MFKTSPILMPNCIYQTRDGRMLEYISTSGKRDDEEKGFRFIDIARIGQPGAVVTVGVYDLFEVLEYEELSTGHGGVR